MPEILATLFSDIEDMDKLWVYGDAGYHNASGIIGSISKAPNGVLTSDERYHNRAMSKLRIAVEHGFGKVINLWENCGYTKGLRVGMQSVGTIYMVAVLLMNIHTCLNGSQISNQFNCVLPTLEYYLNSSSIDTPNKSLSEL